MKLKKAFFMLDKLRRDLRTPQERYAQASDVISEGLGQYYFVFDEERVSGGKEQALIRKFDQNGIPINKTYVDVEGQDYVYFPISIGQMGLAVYHTWLKTKKPEDLKRFLHFADWFMENADLSPALGARWLSDVPLPQYKTPAGWASAFSQARAMNILLRAYQETGDHKFAHMAEKALPAFRQTTQKGGVMSETPWGPFYEEYAAEVPTLVLNGKIFALFGLFDFVRVFPHHSEARELFQLGIDALKKALPAFDMGYWSRYNLCDASWYPKLDPSTIQYQRLHISQLEVLFRITGESLFSEYALRFRQQDTMLNAIRAYGKKFQSLRKLKRL